MYKAAVQGSNPETAVAIAEQPMGIKPANGVWERIRFGFPIDESFDSAVPADQQRAVIVFGEALYAVRLSGQLIEFGKTRIPSPHPVLDSGPEIALAVLIQI